MYLYFTQLVIWSIDQITIKTPNPKGRLFLKTDLYRNLAACVYLSEDPSPLLHTVLTINVPVVYMARYRRT
jgi:hypothetical protein